MTTTGRVRRSIRFAQLDARSVSTAQVSSLRRERLTVSDRLEMPSYQNTQDWTSGMGMSPSGRFQIVEGSGRRQRLVTREGIRNDAARVILWILLVLMSVTLLVRFASVGASAIQIQKLERRIAVAQEAGAKKKAELAASTGDISVCTKAVEMNLISSGGAPTIVLRVPDGATMTLVQTRGTSPTEEPGIRASLTNTD